MNNSSRLEKEITKLIDKFILLEKENSIRINRKHDSEFFQCFAKYYAQKPAIILQRATAFVTFLENTLANATGPHEAPQRGSQKKIPLSIHDRRRLPEADKKHKDGFAIHHVTPEPSLCFLCDN